jgi:hypothetical protein
MRRPNQRRLAFMSAVLPTIAFAIFTASPVMSNEVPPGEGGGVATCYYAGGAYSQNACVASCTRVTERQKCQADGAWSECQSC